MESEDAGSYKPRFLWLSITLALAFVGYASWTAWYCDLMGGRAMPRLPKLTVKASSNRLAERFATDGNSFTRWDSGREMAGNESLTFDLGEIQEVRGVTLDSARSPGDYPRGVRIEISTDGLSFQEVLNQPTAPPRDVQTYTFPKPERVQFVRVLQTGQAAGRYWSVHEATFETRRLVQPIVLRARWGECVWLLSIPVIVWGTWIALRTMLRRRTLTPGRGVVFLCLSFALAMLAASFVGGLPKFANPSTGLLNEEDTWGFYWLRAFSPATRALAVSGIVLVAIPGVNRRMRLTIGGAIRRYAEAMGAAGPWFIVIALTLSSWWLASQTFYSDGEATIRGLRSGEIINWREPLDRYITSQVYRFTSQYLRWEPQPAIALVSCAAGVIYWVVALALARLLAVALAERVILFLFLILIGAVQVYFGNIENYGLLGAGTMLYLYLGLRYLHTGRGLHWAVLALTVTTWIHLSAIWLAPTLPLLAVLRLADYVPGFDGWSYHVTRSAWRRCVAETAVGVLAAAAVSGGTLALGLHFLGSATGLSQTNFGGGDGKLWVPLFDCTTPYEKFTMFSAAHFRATLNELLLICPIGVFLVLGYLLITPRATRRYDRACLFLLSASAGYLAYIFLFNPDMAIANVGILNEWDLFSPPAWPLIVLGAVLWQRWEPPTRDHKHYVAAVVIATGMMHTAAWILSNAKISF